MSLAVMSKTPYVSPSSVMDLILCTAANDVKYYSKLLTCLLLETQAVENMALGRDPSIESSVKGNLK